MPQARARFADLADSSRPQLRAGAVDAGGDAEQGENLALWFGGRGLEGAQQLAVGVGQLVAGDAGEDLEDAGDGQGDAAAGLAIQRQLRWLADGHLKAIS